MNQENIQDIYPLSPMQQGMLFHSLYAPESEVYTEQLSCTLKGNLDIEAFRKAWQTVVNRHDMFRTAFVWEDLDEPLQVVHKQAEVPFELVDWSDKTAEEVEKEYPAFRKAERQRGLDLNEAPVMRVVLIRVSDDSYRLVWSHHHLLLDGWGLPIVLKEVISFYLAYVKGQELHLPPPRPYRDYIAWLQAQDMDKAREFWTDRLKGIEAPTPIPVKRSAANAQAGYDKRRIVFPAEDSELLHRFSKTNQITLNTLLQAGWALLLHRYSQEDDVVFGSTVSGRPPELPGVEQIMGLFINTLPVRISIDAQKSILDWLKTIQLEQAETRQYEYTPLVDIRKWSDVPNSMPLFESIIVFENYPAGEQLAQQENELELSDINSFERTNFPLTVVGAPSKQFTVEIAFETDLFAPETIENMLRHLRTIITAMVRQPQKSLKDVPMLDEQEYRQLVYSWNESKLPLPPPSTLHGLFMEQAAKTPDAVAIRFNNQTISYKEADIYTNRLAHYLRKKGVNRGTMVAISLQRSMHIPLSVFGVFKAGGAYLPIDPDYPADRIEYMLKDSAASILITESALADRFRDRVDTIIELDKIEDELAALPDSPLPESADAHDLAYIIYTSGSTGQPKAVLLHHYGAVLFFSRFNSDVGLQPGRTMPQIASFSFDISTTEIVGSLTSGATLLILDKETLLAPAQLAESFRKYNVTTMLIPPSLLTLLPEDELPAMHTVMSGGDVCPQALARRWMNRCRFLNGYGPTETTIGVLWNVVSEDILEGLDTVPLGYPPDGVRVYVLDKNLNPVPVGVPGELHIGGPSLAWGYLNRPDITAEKFIPDPFSGIEGERLYKTGDLVRRLPDGRIDFIGRVDFQVKVRGFRIELGEIEARLNEIEEVAESIVIVREDTPGEKRLAAYVRPKEGKTIDVSKVRDYLKQKLTEYMVPPAIVALDEFPLLPSGKINRRALPVPEQSDLTGDLSYTAPRTPEEELIASIWADVLGLDKVGVKSSFFDLGGHSLLATQVISRLRDAFEVDLELRHLFEKPTVEQVAIEIDRIRKQEAGVSAPPIEKVPRDQDLPLSFAQQRLWFLDQLAPGNTSYNIPTAMRLGGNLNVEALEKSLQEIVRRHESLRTVFSDKEGTPVQIIKEDIGFRLKKTDLSGLPAEEREREVMRLATEDTRIPFDLSSGPLFRAHLIKLADDDHAIIFNMHHIISDGWSVGVLINEVIQLYMAFGKGLPSPLPELEIQYPDFAAWQRKWLSGEVLQKQIDYWKEQLAGAPPLLELPTDRPRPAMQTFNGAKEPVRFSPELSEAVRKLSQELSVTPFMALLAAFQTLLHRYSGQDQILVGSPIANRTNSAIEKLIGFFVNTLVLKADFSESPSFEDLLLQVRETALGAYAHQDLPFEKLVEELKPERDMSHSPLFQVAFVLQNAPTQDVVELPDLTMRALDSASTVAKYDLTLTMVEAGEEFVGSMEYNTDLFDRETIVRMLEHLKIVIQQMTADPEAAVGAMPLLTEREKQQILFDWNQSAKPYAADKTVHRIIEEYARKQPQATALVYQDKPGQQAKERTYAELNERANKLAHYLIKKGVRAESIVGICMDRSLDMAESMLAILKAGGAYVPIDPAYPDDRIRHMIEDSGLKVLLTQEKLLSRLSAHPADFVAVDALQPEIEKESPENPDVPLDPENLAYVIYTSGSTGKPKGTLLRHRGACNLAAAQKEAFNIQTNSRILQFASLSFDAATWEFVMAMLNGAALVLTSAETIASGEQLTELLAEQKITTITLPPSVLAVWPKKQLPDLRTIITAGEAVSGDLVSEWGAGRQFVNAYGPTESTVCASMHECKGSYAQGPPIGRPIGNFQLYILDQYLQPVPVGAAGELCIGGIGLARGYHNLPDLTAEKFIPNPFGSEPGARLYRTGDLARYLPDGNIEFLGRIDFQVKVRGFRIELGEIEAVLSQHEQIKDLTVIAREDKPGDKRLVAYIVPEENSEPDVNLLRAFLRERLPEYMVPAAFVMLDALPLTPNGKVDRRALPKPELTRDDLSAEYVAPRNENEEKLAAIVGELLHIEKVGVNDNFFELGGHSLLATQFMSRVKSTFQVELPLRTLFEKPTTALIAEEIEKAKKQGEASTPAAPKIKRVARSARTVKRSDLEE